MKKKTKELTVKFKEWLCNINFKQYSNERIAIQLTEVGTNEPILTATVNLPQVELKQDEIAIKNYSENEGIAEVLYKAGIISLPLRYVQSGFVQIPICNLLISPYGR